jgi:hypothetical protein
MDQQGHTPENKRLVTTYQRAEQVEKKIFKEKINHQSVVNESRERKYKNQTSMLAQEATTPG